MDALWLSDHESGYLLTGTDVTIRVDGGGNFILAPDAGQALPAAGAVTYTPPLLPRPWRRGRGERVNMEGFSNEQGYPSSAHQDSRATVQREIDAQVAADLEWQGRRTVHPQQLDSECLPGWSYGISPPPSVSGSTARPGTGSDARHRQPDPGLPRPT